MLAMGPADFQNLGCGDKSGDERSQVNGRASDDKMGGARIDCAGQSESRTVGRIGGRGKLLNSAGSFVQKIQREIQWNVPVVGQRSDDRYLLVFGRRAIAD